jgi:nucleoside-diphosphate-sugar epimerase
MTRAAVVGAAGFIGSHLCRYLQSRGSDVLGIDRREIVDKVGVAIRGEFPHPQVCEAIAAHRAQQIYLLAGTSSVGVSLADPLADLSGNARDTLSFLEWMRQTDIRSTVVFVSSAAVYGEPAQLPATTATPVHPISPYGISKLAGELYMRLYARLHGLDTRVIRPFSIYGPRLRKQVVFDMLVKLHQPEPAALFGTGQETRDFVYVDDLCAALVRVGEAGSPAGIYNVCSGQETSIATIAQRLSEYTGRPPLTFTGKSRPGDPLRWRGACPELQALGWQPAVSLDDGLRMTVDWFNTVNAI